MACKYCGDSHSAFNPCSESRSAAQVMDTPETGPAGTDKTSARPNPAAAEQAQAEHNETIAEWKAEREHLIAVNLDLTAQLEAERKAREVLQRFCDASRSLDNLRGLMEWALEQANKAEAAEAKLAAVEADTIERCVKVCDEHARLHYSLWDFAAAIRALRTAAAQEAKRQSLGEDSPSEQPAPAADPYGTDSEGWSKDPNHWANKEKP